MLRNTGKALYLYEQSHTDDKESEKHASIEDDTSAAYFAPVPLHVESVLVASINVDVSHQPTAWWATTLI